MTKLDTLIASLPDAPFRQQLTDEIESLRHDNTSLLHLLAQIREACGDNGKRMQDELVTYIRDEWQGHISHIALLTATLKKERAEKLRGECPWQPIATAPKGGRTLLLGCFNSLGKWRTMRGQWMGEDYIAEYWEDPDGAEPGWFETAVEADDTPNCWRIKPTHWMPLPQPPKEESCKT